MPRRSAAAKNGRPSPILSVATPDDPAAEWVSPDSLVPWPKNPQKNVEAAVQAIARSLVRFGQGRTIVARRENREVIAGHKTLEAAKQLGWTRVAVRFVDLSPEEAHAYALADNKTSEIAEWEEKLLAEALAEVKLYDEGALLATGFSDAEIDRLVTQTYLDGEHALGKDGAIIGDRIGGGDPPELAFGAVGSGGNSSGKGLDGEDLGAADDDPDSGVRGKNLSAKYAIRHGSRFRVIGQVAHEVVCGDGLAFQPEEPIGLLVHDPPWTSIDQRNQISADNVLVFCDGGCAGRAIGTFGPPTWIFVWDCGACWYTPNRPLRRMKMCLWYGSLTGYNYDGAHYGEPGRPHTVTNSRGTYEYVPDPRGKHLADLFSASLSALHASGGHAHEKPLDWLRMLIGNCSNGAVFDPFLGSGTALLAADQLKRQCIGVELDPDTLGGALARFENAGLTVTPL